MFNRNRQLDKEVEMMKAEMECFKEAAKWVCIIAGKLVAIEFGRLVNLGILIFNFVEAYM